VPDAAEVAKRDPLRPLIGAGTCFLLYRILLAVLYPVGRFLGGEMIALTVPELVAAAIAAALAMAIFESDSPPKGLGDIGLAWVAGTLRNLSIGVAIGVVAAALAVLPAVAFGLAHFQYSSNADVSWGGALFTPVLLFCGALGEEIAFRGFTLQYLMRGYGRWAAILGTGALFGLLHAGNPGATTMSTINTTGFGIVFGAAVLRSRDLWLPAGIHFAWNASLPFLGVGLSGLTIKVTGYELIWRAGDLWSGGSYGPEASVITSMVIVLVLVAVWKVPVARGTAYLVPESAADELAVSPR
jgi:membrane protease YdiL (CAAX protease family)